MRIPSRPAPVRRAPAFVSTLLALAVTAGLLAAGAGTAAAATDHPAATGTGASPAASSPANTPSAEPAGRGDAPVWTRRSGHWTTHPYRADYTIDVDYSRTPDLADFGERVRSTLQEWYPRINELLPTDGFVPPQTVHVVFDPDATGVAGTTDTTIVANPAYFRDHPDDVGAFVHEAVHVSQQYGSNAVPGWLTEGVADEIRYYDYQPDDNPIMIGPDDYYTEGYGPAAFLLHYAQTTYDPHLIAELNDAARRNVYSDQLWVTYTGKTPDELWHEATGQSAT